MKAYQTNVQNISNFNFCLTSWNNNKPAICFNNTDWLKQYSFVHNSHIISFKKNNDSIIYGCCTMGNKGFSFSISSKVNSKNGLEYIVFKIIGTPKSNWDKVLDNDKAVKILIDYLKATKDKITLELSGMNTDNYDPNYSGWSFLKTFIKDKNTLRFMENVVKLSSNNIVTKQFLDFIIDHQNLLEIRDKN